MQLSSGKISEKSIVKTKSTERRESKQFLPLPIEVGVSLLTILMNDTSKILTWFGIYPDTIIENAKKCTSALDNVNCTKSEINDWYETVKESVKETCDINNITDSIIESCFSATKELLQSKGYDIDYYTNCEDSHLYINGQEYQDGDEIIIEESYTDDYNDFVNDYKNICQITGDEYEEVSFNEWLHDFHACSIYEFYRYNDKLFYQYQRYIRFINDWCDYRILRAKDKKMRDINLEYGLKCEKEEETNSFAVYMILNYGNMIPLHFREWCDDYGEPDYAEYANLKKG